MKMSRRDSRETAFALLFEWSFKDDSLDEIIEQAEIGRDIVVDSFAYSLTSTAIGHCSELDAEIEKHSRKWKLNRLSKPTLAILRLSIGEITQMPDIPIGVTINEAVELAKKYATKDEASFINGVLGGLARSLDRPVPEELLAEIEQALNSEEADVELPKDSEDVRIEVAPASETVDAELPQDGKAPVVEVPQASEASEVPSESVKDEL